MIYQFELGAKSGAIGLNVIEVELVIGDVAQLEPDPPNPCFMGKNLKRVY
jgi:hypothetical protein